MRIAKRYGEQLQDLRGFIRPSEIFYQEGGVEKDALSEALAKRTKLEQQDTWLCWDWVCREVAYPPYRTLSLADWHREQAFLDYRVFYYRRVKERTSRDFWQYPYETLELPMMGDCEDTSYLLASILRNFLPAAETWVCLGLWNVYGHAWVSMVKDGTRFVLETAIDEAPAFEVDPYRVLEENPYIPLIWVNDETVIFAENASCYFEAPRMGSDLIEEIKGAYGEFFGSMIEEIREAYQKLEVR